LPSTQNNYALVYDARYERPMFTIGTGNPADTDVSDLKFSDNGGCLAVCRYGQPVVDFYPADLLVKRSDYVEADSMVEFRQKYACGSVGFVKGGNGMFPGCWATGSDDCFLTGIPNYGVSFWTNLNHW
jgi:hypothetical protein